MSAIFNRLNNSKFDELDTAEKIEELRKSIIDIIEKMVVRDE